LTPSADENLKKLSAVVKGNESNRTFLDGFFIEAEITSFYLHVLVLFVILDASVLHCRLAEHTDAVWGLTVNGAKMLSCSADGTVKLWNTDNNTELLKTFRIETGLYYCHTICC
jgi:WD40 repeat protein